MISNNTLYMIPYLLSLAITVALAGYTWKHRSTRGNIIFTLILLAEASWIFGYIFELLSPQRLGKIFWDDFQYIGTLFVPVLLFIYILQYTDQMPVHSKRLVAILITLPCLFLGLLYTNPWHGLIRHQSWIEPGKPFDALIYTYTWPMWVVFIYIYIILLASLALLIRYLYTQNRTYRMQRILLISGFIMPIIGGIFSLSGIDILGQRDSSPLFFAVGNIFLAVGLFRFGLFDITPIARDVIFGTMDDLVIILDKMNRVVDINPAACEIFHVAPSAAIGLSVTQFLPHQIVSPEHLRRSPQSQEEMILPGDDGDPLYFDLHILDLLDKNQHEIVGSLWIAHNITKMKRIQIELHQIQDELEARILQRTADLTAANEALRNERDFAQQIMTTMGQGLTVTNTKGEFEYVNPAFAKMVGREAKDLIGTIPDDITYQENLPILKKALIERQSMQTTNYELNLIHANGDLIQVLITGVPRILNGRYAGTVATITDLTERKNTDRIQSAIYQISEAARITHNPEEFFLMVREIVSQLMPTRNLYVALYDPVSDLLNIAFRDENFRGPVTPQKLGKGITAYVLRTGVPLLATPEVFEKLVAEGQVERLGNQKVDWLGAPLITSKGIIGVMAAHTYSENDRMTEKDKNLLTFVAGQVATALERKQAEDALRVSEERYRALVKNLPDSAILLFDQNINLVLVDGPEIERLGYSKNQLEGNKLQDVLSPELVTLLKPAIHVALEGKQTSTEFTLDQRAYQFTCLPFEVNPGNVYGMILLRNITTRKLAETEREKLIQELENKNAELERFTYTVSHDLKSPLITIRGYLGFLEKDTLSGNTDRMKHDQNRIVEATDKMQRLLSELLELSRIGRMVNPSREIPFKEVVDEAINLVSGRIREQGIAIQISDCLPDVYGDKERLVEVVQNLVDNACKFMGNQIYPCIEIGLQDQDDDGNPILFVRDNGIGIEPKYFDNIFGLFNKLDGQSEGTGVGLALVKRIIEVHNSKIWVQSEGLGKGTTFYFTLPSPGQTSSYS